MLFLFKCRLTRHFKIRLEMPDVTGEQQISHDVTGEQQISDSARGDSNSF